MLELTAERFLYGMIHCLRKQHEDVLSSIRKKDRVILETQERELQEGYDTLHQKRSKEVVIQIENTTKPENKKTALDESKGYNIEYDILVRYLD